RGEAPPKKLEPPGRSAPRSGAESLPRLSPGGTISSCAVPQASLSPCPVARSANRGILESPPVGATRLAEFRRPWRRVHPAPNVPNYEVTFRSEGVLRERAGSAKQRRSQPAG